MLRRIGAGLVPTQLWLDHWKALNIAMDVTIDGRTWVLSDSIGSGGFGRVYIASCEGEEAVIKLVPKDPGAQRELLLAGDLSGVPNVVPVYRVGDAGDSWSILMPRAEQSLRDYLLAIGGPVNLGGALPIMQDIAQALVSLQKVGVVHRDLKPENVLLLAGHWCLTDFGISRYAEATTAADTRKYSMTRPYAAPEQWRSERTTSATDVYAFGVVAFELLAGRWPFQGPDFRDQHLHHVPPELPDAAGGRLNTLIDECLAKAPEARPTPSRLAARLQLQMENELPAGEAMQALRKAHQEHVTRAMTVAREKEESQSKEEWRVELFNAAQHSYSRIGSRLDKFIRSAVPELPAGWPLRLGHAELSLSDPVRSGTRDGYYTSYYRDHIDVVAHAHISVTQSNYWYRGRSHALWFCDAETEGEYGWFETAFIGPRRPDELEPFAANPDDYTGLVRELNTRGSLQVCWPFTLISGPALDEFIERWAEWFADASLGNLRHPLLMSRMEVEGTWRLAPGWDK